MGVEEWSLDGVANLAKVVRLVINMKKGPRGVPSTSVDKEQEILSFGEVLLVDVRPKVSFSKVSSPPPLLF
jgi:hypothetical protein